MKRSITVYFAFLATMLSPMLANAGLITHQDAGGWLSGREPGSAPMGRLTVDKSININKFGVLMDIKGDSDLQFFIYDADTGSNLLTSSIIESVDVGLGYYFTDRLNFRFIPNTVYSVGAVSSNGAWYAVDMVANSISGFNFLTGNQNIRKESGSYILNTGTACCDVMTAFQVGRPRKVPEPHTFALLGLGLAGIAALRRTKTATEES